jgi:hypothetical protein
MSMYDRPLISFNFVQFNCLFRSSFLPPMRWQSCLQTLDALVDARAWVSITFRYWWETEK